MYAINATSTGPEVVSLGNYSAGAQSEAVSYRTLLSAPAALRGLTVLMVAPGVMEGGLSAMRGATGPTMLFWGLHASNINPDGRVLSAPAVPGAKATVINRGTAQTPTGVTVLPQLSGVVFGARYATADVYRMSTTGGSVTKIPGPANSTGLGVESIAVIPGTSKLMVAQNGVSGTPYGLFTLDMATGAWEPFNAQPHMLPYSIGFARVAAPTAPTVTEVSPSSGPQDANTTVFVIGSGFKPSPSLACLFGRSVLVRASFQTSEVVKCVAQPSPVAGKAQVQVTNDGVHYSTQLVYFTYTAASSTARR